MKRLGSPWRSIEPDLHRPRPHRHQPGTTRPPRSLSRLPGRRHSRGRQTRPTGSLPTRCQRHHRRAHRHGRRTQHRRIRPRSDRPGRATAVHRPRNGGRVRIRLDVHRAGTHSTSELAELFNVARSTVYRTVQRQSVDRRNTLAGSRCRAKQLSNGPDEPRDRQQSFR